jgi:hypothetical protein
MSSLPWKMLSLRASNDIIASCVNAPRRVEGYFTYFTETVDLLFPRNSGLRMRLFKAGTAAELRSKLWDKSAEISVDDLVDEQARSLASLYEKMAPRQVD